MYLENLGGSTLNREAEETRKNLEAEERRALHLARLAEASKKAKDHKEKVKILTDQAKKDTEQTKDYEKELEDISERGEGSKKRIASTSSPDESRRQSKKTSPMSQVVEVQDPLQINT